jgi:hypothetical protein
MFNVMEVKTSAGDGARESLLARFPGLPGSQERGTHGEKWRELERPTQVP